MTHVRKQYTHVQVDATRAIAGARWQMLQTAR